MSRRLEHGMNSVLEDAGRLLAPSEDQLTYVNNVIDKVATALKTNGGRFGVDRVVVSGSKGKNTCLRTKFDVDLVVFVNDVEPPFEDTFDRVEDLLMLNFNDYDGKKGPYSLQCVIQGVPLDILLATNMVPLTTATTTNGPSRAQRKGLMLKFAGPEVCFNDVRPYSVAFCETVCDFMANQPEQVHAAIRLSKFWSKTLIWFDHKADRSMSYATELLVCRAFEVARDQAEAGRGPTMMDIFHAFLRQLVDWKAMRIVCFTYYEERDVPGSVLQDRPLLLDPANPWNNVTRGLPWEGLAHFAAGTLRKIENPLISFQDLFMIQFDPAGLSHVHRILSRGGLTMADELIGRDSHLVFPRDLFYSIEHNRGAITDEPSQLLIDAVQRMAIAATHTGLLVDVPFIESAKAAVGALHTSVLHLPPPEWTTPYPENPHQDRDVTLRIPCFYADGSTGTGLLSFSVTGCRRA
jgi:hypothetical protein